MRRVKVGAIQPAGLPVLPEHQPFSAEFRPDARSLAANYALPRLEATAALLERAGREGFDIVSTSEDVCGISRYLAADTSQNGLFGALAAETAPLAEARLSGIAKKYGMNIIGCYFKRYGGKNYNTAAAFGRGGEIAGEYRKTHIPPDELWHVEPGGSLEPIDLDCARIGALICYDMMFPEAAGVLAARGAELIFHPTGGYGWYDAIGEATLRARANDNSVHIVTAKNYVFNCAGKSSVIDYWGQVLADAGFSPDALVGCEIDLSAQKTQPEWFYQSRMSGEARVGLRKRGERRPDLYGSLAESSHPRFAAPSEEGRRILAEQIRNGECRWS
ncbi:MAG: carbon-nitrogen hydrolase family protein [Clostridiales bacterium]|jgi:predicted amidohydrolase|nr:carbon-nitrogen hydrolase family protein [Clostridiales bacterium]